MPQKRSPGLNDRAAVESRLRASITVVDSGCWEWSQYRNSQGYGRVSLIGTDGIRTRQYPTHRIAAYLWLGLDLADRWMLACHHCDNPPCINPDHLFLGTSRDNQMDSYRKGRRGVYYRTPLIYSRTKPCEVCGVIYEPSSTRRKLNKTCSQACRDKLLALIKQQAPGHKLSSGDVSEIKAALRLGNRTGPSLAAQYGVSTSFINAIRAGRKWKNVA